MPLMFTEKMGCFEGEGCWDCVSAIIIEEAVSVVLLSVYRVYSSF